MNDKIIAQLFDIASILEKSAFPEAAAYASMAAELVAAQIACTDEATAHDYDINERHNFC